MNATHTWGIFNKRGELVHVGLYGREKDAWIIYLGWPNDEEIEVNKRQGLHAARVEVVRSNFALSNGERA
jgi:hypothetical protein